MILDDAEILRLFRLLQIQQATKTVRSLLAGNDTGCFTTQQYQAAYEKVGKCWVPDALARIHLTLPAVAKLVQEVKPNVWAATLPAEGLLRRE